MCSCYVVLPLDLVLFDVKVVPPVFLDWLGLGRSINRTAGLAVRLLLPGGVCLILADQNNRLVDHGRLNG